jgi:hypothetical protein
MGESTLAAKDGGKNSGGRRGIMHGETGGVVPQGKYNIRFWNIALNLQAIEQRLRRPVPPNKREKLTYEQRRLSALLASQAQAA